METIGLCEPEELSLFGGDQLLMGLGSPLEPDSPVSFPDVRDDTNHLDLLGLAQYPDKHKSVGTSFVVPTTPSQDGLTGLEFGWMDTRLDLFDLLQDSKPDVLDIGSFDMGSNAALAPVTDVVPSTEVEPTSIDDLFNQMSRSLEPSDHVVQTAADEQDLLSEVLTKLTRYVEQADDGVSIIPDLSNGVLSPVSVTDIESLLSDSDNLLEISPNDSGLESLLSSRPESPNVQYVEDPDYVPSESSSARRKKKSARSTPYGKLPRDRKERKKIQNKTAALKYRQKKKDENHQVAGDVEQLESRNTELKDKVESLTREIQYLKDLMAEVLKAKSIKV